MDKDNNKELVLKDPEIVQSFKTSDGEIFKYINEAEEHQKYIDLSSWYNDHSLYTSEGTIVDFDDLVEWINRPSCRNFIRKVMKL